MKVFHHKMQEGDDMLVCNQHGEGVYKSVIIHWSEHWKWKHIHATKINVLFSKAIF
jgi:hypothetical protein